MNARENDVIASTDALLAAHPPHAFSVVIECSNLRALLALARGAEQVRAVLARIEFGSISRYGYACPSCHELRTGGSDYGAGPDRGHGFGCELRAVLDLGNTVELPHD